MRLLLGLLILNLKRFPIGPDLSFFSHLEEAQKTSKMQTWGGL